MRDVTFIIGMQFRGRRSLSIGCIIWCGKGSKFAPVEVLVPNDLFALADIVDSDSQYYLWGRMFYISLSVTLNYNEGDEFMTDRVYNVAYASKLFVIPF
jgi:hypothetical protein